MPSDISEALTQDQLADSLETAPVVDAPEKPEAEEETTEQEVAPEVEETAEDWLPTEQEKVFSEETLTKYAQQRYPKLYDRLQKDPNDADLKQLLHDKLNTDIYLKTLQDKPEQEEAEEEPAPRQEPTQTVSAQEWAKQVDEVARQYINPDMANHFAKGFINEVFDVKDALPPEKAMKLAHVFTSGVINVVNSVLMPMLQSPLPDGRTAFQHAMGTNYEGFDDSYESSMYDRAWQSVTRGNPEFAKLPGYGDASGTQQRIAAATKIAGSPEDFDALQFRGKDGKSLSAYQTAVKKYSMMARVMAGENLTPVQSKAVFEAGKKAARKLDVNRQAGNLGSGKSNGQIASNPSDADFWKDGVDEYQRQHGRI